MFKTYIIIAVVGSMVATVGLLYYRDTQKRISTLQQNNAKLEVAVQSKEAALNEMTANFEKQSRLNKELTGKLEDAEKDQDDLRSKLQKHDLTRLSIGKPGMMEKRINDDTKKLFSDFESITAK
tara:strand:- start:1014 stop:1385 length:372 start_codon:yes stop_codon:yes gene_type:complete